MIGRLVGPHREGLVLPDRTGHLTKPRLALSLNNMDIKHNVVGWFEIPVNDIEEGK